MKALAMSTSTLSSLSAAVLSCRPRATARGCESLTLTLCQQLVLLEVFFFFFNFLRVKLYLVTTRTPQFIK